MSDTVWLHGTALNGLRWGPDREGLWLDLPGHGSAPRTEPRVEAYAEALAPQLPERFALAGHSLGGMVALQLAATHPDRCRGLILVDAPLALPGWMPGGLGARLAPLMARFPGPRGFARVIARRTANTAMRPAVRRTIAATPTGALADAMIAVTRYDGRAALAGLRLPVLALYARQSVITSAADRCALRACPTADLHDFDAGHMLPFDAAAQVDPLISRFLEALP